MADPAISANQLPLPQLPDVVPNHPLVQTVLTHWNVARGTNLVPSRAAVTMRGLGRALPFISIFESRGDDLVIRLAGTELRQFAGADVTGKSVRTFTATQDWGERFARLNRAVHHPFGVWAVLNWALLNGDYAKVGRLHLPLCQIGAAGNKGLLNLTVTLQQKADRWPAPGDPDHVPIAEAFIPFSIGAGLPDLPANAL